MTVEEIIAPFVKKDAKRLTDKLEKIKDRFKTSGITSGNISAVLLCVIVEVDKIKKLKGSEKKQLVVALLNNIIGRDTRRGRAYGIDTQGDGSHYDRQSGGDDEIFQRLHTVY